MTNAEPLAEARRLYRQQVKARGTVPFKTLDGKPCDIPGPYVPNATNEARARRILKLRKEAAR